MILKAQDGQRFVKPVDARTSRVDVLMQHTQQINVSQWAPLAVRKYKRHQITHEIMLVLFIIPETQTFAPVPCTPALFRASSDCCSISASQPATSCPDYHDISANWTECKIARAALRECGYVHLTAEAAMWRALHILHTLFWRFVWPAEVNVSNSLLGIQKSCRLCLQSACTRTEREGLYCRQVEWMIKEWLRT